MKKYRIGSVDSTSGSPFQLSFLTVLLYLLISLIILAVLNFRVILFSLLNYTIGPENHTELTPITDNLFNFMGKLNTPVLMIFWAIFGALVYSLIWFSQNVLFTIGKEVEESHYLKGGVAPEGGYWHRVLLSNLSFIALLVFWVLYMIIFFGFILPWASKMFYNAFYETTVLHRAIDVGGAVLVTAASIYILWAIQHILTASWRAYRN